MMKNKLKILVCTSYKHAWNSVRPEAEIFIALAKLGHEITIVTQGDAEYVARVKEFGIKVIPCYPKRKICPTTIRTIRKELKSYSYDICYAFNSKTIPNAAIACTGIDVKLVAYRGTTGGLYRHDPSAYLTILNPRINGVICVSDSVRRDVTKKVWKNKNNVVTIYKGQSLEWYKVQPTDRLSLDLKESDIVGICAAHVRPSKGISVLLQATHKVEAKNFHLLLAGHGFEPHFDEIKDSPMSDRIHYIGHRSDVPSLMCMADIQIQPSISGEGLPRTIIEAMANGTPSIVTTTGGSPELVEDGKTGLIVPTNDAEELAKAINALSNDKALCVKMGENAKNRLEEAFGSEITVEKHLNYFYRLLES